MIRPADRARDGAAVWAILPPTLAAGDTYDWPRDWSECGALDAWFSPRAAVFVAEKDGAVLGSYFVRPNGLGGGAHVANAGFIVADEARGRGTGRALGLHALETARGLGYAAMQFNHVLASNRPAVALWTSLSFREIGRAPNAFRLPTSELTDQIIMFQEL